VRSVVPSCAALHHSIEPQFKNNKWPGFNGRHWQLAVYIMRSEAHMRHEYDMLQPKRHMSICEDVQRQISDAQLVFMTLLDIYFRILLGGALYTKKNCKKEKSKNSIFGSVLGPVW